MNLANDRVLDEKIRNLRKAIEIVGGIDLIEDLNSIEELKYFLLKSYLNTNEGKIVINNCEYSPNELLKIKLDYEKTYLKSKNKTIQAVIYKIKEYNTDLTAQLRKYKKSGAIGEFNKIYETIDKMYKYELDQLVLSEINNRVFNSNIREALEKNYYGEYLIGKKDQIINIIIDKLL